MQTNVLIKEECILKNENKSCPYKKLSVFYNSCLKSFGSHLVYTLETRSCFRYIIVNTKHLQHYKLKKLKERANKCIDQGGMYFEEQK